METKPKEEDAPLWWPPVGQSISQIHKPAKYFENENIKSLVEEAGGLLPEDSQELDKELNERIRNFIGVPLTDDQYDKLSEYCSKPNITDNKPKYHWISEGKEFPSVSGRQIVSDALENVHTNTLQHLKSRMKIDLPCVYSKTVKHYTGLVPQAIRCIADTLENEVVPQIGQDMIFRIKIYHPYNRQLMKCTQEVAVLGSTKLTDFRDMIKCPNDLGLTVDCSNNPDAELPMSVQSIFPSGFLFINGVFYEDKRDINHIEYSAVLRQWAKEKGIGNFPAKSMEDIKFEDLKFRFGYPEVYVHQGKCEHKFTFSSVALASPSNSEKYPMSVRLANSLNNIQCMMCGMSISKWVVLDSQRFIFQSAYYCTSCFKKYNYKDGQKLEDFKAYRLHAYD